MTKDEALQVCLEYIETNAHERRHVRWAIKEALAQPPLPVLETRKIAPYPAVPADIEPVPETWQVIGSVLVGFVLVVLMVVFLLLFFTGLWVWSLLI